MPPPSKLVTGALCDFICHSCRLRAVSSSAAVKRSATRPAQSRQYSSRDPVSQHIPYYPQPVRGPSGDGQPPTQPESPSPTSTTRSRRHARKPRPTPHRGIPSSYPNAKADHASPDDDPAWEQDMGGFADPSTLLKGLGMDPELMEEVLGSDPVREKAEDPAAAKLMKDLGLDEETLENLMDDDKFHAILAQDDLPDINVFNQSPDGRMTKEDIATKETIEDVDAKIREVERALEENEEELRRRDPKELQGIKDLMAMMDPDNLDIPESFRNPNDDADLTVTIPSTSGAATNINLKTIILPDSAWAMPSKSRITQLNDVLIRVGSSLKGNRLTQKGLDKTWKCYSNARYPMSLQWHLVPGPAWNLLWVLFSTVMVPNENRMHRIYILARDMATANITLSPDQQLLAIEAMFTDGWRDEAIQNWKRHISTLGTEPATLVAYWNLGAQMHCLQGDIERAGIALRRVLTSGLDHNPRILFPYIDACTRNTEHQEAAWIAYRQLRDILGEDMKAEDYDEVIDSFLSQNLVEYGLYAFVDMMSGGAIDLHGRDKLPGTFANKFFFGKWLKRLIGAGDLDGAEAVIKMMIGRGIRPAPIQLNGLIGAWFRAGTAESRKKAHDMAWEMIYSRLDFVQARGNTPTLELNGVVRPVDARPPEYRPPRATSETFALLANFYRNQVSFSKLETVWELVKAAEIPIDGYLLTPLLETYQKTGREQEAFDLIFKTADQNRLQLTWATFKPLWVILGVYDPSRNTPVQYSNSRDLARRLFSEMVKSSASLIADRPKVPEYMARLILPAFVNLDDMHGALIALHALVDRFNLLVTDPVALHVLTGHWGIGSTRANAPGSALRVRQAAYKIAAFLARRLASTGKDLKTLGARDRSKELTLYLDRVLCVKIPGLGTDKEVNRNHQHACMEMGVKYQPPPGPSNANLSESRETVSKTIPACI